MRTKITAAVATVIAVEVVLSWFSMKSAVAFTLGSVGGEGARGGAEGGGELGGDGGVDGLGGGDDSGSGKGDGGGGEGDGGEGGVGDGEGVGEGGGGEGGSCEGVGGGGDGDGGGEGGEDEGGGGRGLGEGVGGGEVCGSSMGMPGGGEGGGGKSGGEGGSEGGGIGGKMDSGSLTVRTSRFRPRSVATAKATASGDRLPSVSALASSGPPSAVTEISVVAVRKVLPCTFTLGASSCGGAVTSSELLLSTRVKLAV